MSYTDRPPILGIDLGTSTCLVAVHLEGDRGPTVLIADRQAQTKTMDSVFCYVADKGPLVGILAHNCSLNPDHQKSVKRHVKRRMREPDEPLESGGNLYTPVTISHYYLKELREAAEEQLLRIDGLGIRRGDVRKAVITVPAYFGYRERQATREAGAMAELEVVALLEEPIAGALGMNLQPQDRSRLVLVIDLGGGTIDITLLQVDPDFVEKGFYELGRIGDIDTGCIDWDEELARLIAEKIHGRVKTDFIDRTNTELYVACERAKKQFCDEDFAGESLIAPYNDFILGNLAKPRITLQEFEDRTADLCAYCVRLCDNLLCDVGQHEDLRWKGKRPGEPLTWQDMDEVYMVGGGSHLTAFRRMIEQRWGRKPSVPGIPQHAIVKGAATHARQLWLGEGELRYRKKERSPHTIGYWARPKLGTPHVFVPIICRNSVLPGIFEWKFPVHVRGGAPLLFRIAEECISRFKQDGLVYQDRGRILVRPNGENGGLAGDGNGGDSNGNGTRGVCRLNYSIDGDDIWIEVEFGGGKERIQLDPRTLGPR